MPEHASNTDIKRNNRYYDLDRSATPNTQLRKNVPSSTFSDANFDFDPKSVSIEGGATHGKTGSNANQNTTLQLTHSEKDIVGHQIYGGSDELIEGRLVTIIAS